MTYLKPTITRANIEVGDFTYYSGSDFERQVTHYYEFNHDRLIIGKFCQIGARVEFMMNGANHQMNAASTFPFYILDGWDQPVPGVELMPIKGDTVVGNDVWIGQDALILPGVHIGDGAMVGARAVVGSDVAPYTIVVGNPVRPVRRRVSDELAKLLLEFRWWDLPVGQINAIIPVLSNPDLNNVAAWLRSQLEQRRAQG